MTRICTIYTHNTYHVCVCICRSLAKVGKNSSFVLAICRGRDKLYIDIDTEGERVMEREGEMKLSKFKRICVFCGSSQGKKSSYQDAAIELGNELVLIS